MRHLPVLQPRLSDPVAFDLDALEIETPCEVPWDGMQGDNRVRYCGHCRQNVYNIEALSRAEAVRLRQEPFVDAARVLPEITNTRWSRSATLTPNRSTRGILPGSVRAVAFSPGGPAAPVRLFGGMSQRLLEEDG